VSATQGRLRGLIFRRLGRLRFPCRLALTATLFVLDVVFPDAIPFADEILLGPATLLLARMKRSESGTTPRPQ